ncbi:BTAD domain-containing putative transcriptional regulator [Nocardia brasiliensis]
MEARLNGHRLDNTAPQALAVLAILATEPERTLSTTQLAAQLWSVTPPSSAVNILRNHILALRRAFDVYGGAGAGSVWLESTQRRYQLCLPVELDADEVERLIAAADADRRSGEVYRADIKLARARSLWRGDPLADLSGPWAERKRMRLAEMRSSLRAATISVALELGRYAAAIEESRRLVAAEPHCERWQELLKVALHFDGRRAGTQQKYLDPGRRRTRNIDLASGTNRVRSLPRIPAPKPPATDAPIETPLSSTYFDPSSVRAGLPPDVADFTGRKNLVCELTAVLDRVAQPRPVLAITGMAGVGKTTLAVHLAHRVRNRYSDGTVYLDLGRLDEDPPSAATLLAVALRSVGIRPGALPSDAEERMSLWHNILADKRMLLILDNARDVHQLAPLLPGPGATAALVTSRSSLTELFDARLVPLDVLTADEARALLQRLVTTRRLSDELGAAHEILRACGNLPVALSLVGARLATRPAWPLATVAERLAGEHRRLAELALGSVSVESLFRQSYRLLPPELARAFVLLASCDASELSIPVAAALLDRNRVETEQLCEALVDRGMLQTPHMGRYQYHELMRLFARGVVDPAHRHETPQSHHEASLTAVRRA